MMKLKLIGKETGDELTILVIFTVLVPLVPMLRAQLMPVIWIELQPLKLYVPAAKTPWKSWNLLTSKIK